MDKSEVLVHVSAPSGVADDARYRAQVEAILNFQPHSCQKITADQSSASSSQVPQEAAEAIDPAPRGGAVAAPPASTRHVSQKDSLETPVSVIPDSQPEQPGPALETDRLSLIPELADCERPPKRIRGTSSPPPDPHDVQHDSAGQHSIDPKPTKPTINSPTLVIDRHQGDHKQKAPAETGPRQIDPVLPVLLPLEIKPPLPPISMAPFTTHITPTLDMLTTRLKSSRTYNPTAQSRALETLERGYWHLRINLVSSLPSPGETTTNTNTNLQYPAPNNFKLYSHPTTWNKNLFTRFWSFLSDFIAKEGRAGWGVWCILQDADADADAEADSSSPASTADKNSDVLIPVETDGLVKPDGQSLDLKVYAWGEIACHVYLLLFLASERRIRKMGAQWRDARDEVVIQMPGL